MRRVALLLAVCFTLPLFADPPAPEGRYKLGFPIGGGRTITFLVGLSKSADGLKGDYLGADPELSVKPVLSRVKTRGDRLELALQLGGQALLFDGRLPTEAGKPIKGSLRLDGQLTLAELEPTKLEKLDRFALDKELVNRPDASGTELFNAIAGLVANAGVQKVPADEVRGWLAKANKAADAYGHRWQQSIATKLTATLAGQPAYAALALEQARRAERLIEPADEADDQLPILEPLARLLEEAGKADEAKEIRGRLAKLADRDYRDYEKVGVEAVAYAGRKAPGERAVLVELFTGSECVPCVASDRAFDALAKAYKPSEVILLQYHLHINAPDPLGNPDTEVRQRQYGNATERLPTCLVDGKDAAPNSGPAAAAAKKLVEYRQVIDDRLERPAGCGLKLVAARAGEQVTAQVTVSDAKPSDKLRLRVVLVEERVRFRGGNGQRYHHAVVRHFLGGPDGTPLTKASEEFRFAAPLPAIRLQLNAYLDAVAKEAEASFPDRPMEFRDLAVVAFVQDDATTEVLQAVRTPVGEAGK